MSRKSPATASLEHAVIGDEVVARLHGEIDLSNRDMLTAALDQMTATGKHVIIDLSDLDFIDVGTARLLQRAATGTDGRGVRFELVNPRPIVRRLLILLGMDPLLAGARSVPELRPDQAG